LRPPKSKRWPNQASRSRPQRQRPLAPSACGQRPRDGRPGIRYRRRRTPPGLAALRSLCLVSDRAAKSEHRMIDCKTLGDDSNWRFESEEFAADWRGFLFVAGHGRARTALRAFAGSCASMERNARLRWPKARSVSRCATNRRGPLSGAPTGSGLCSSSWQGTGPETIFSNRFASSRGMRTHWIAPVSPRFCGTASTRSPGPSTGGFACFPAIGEPPSGRISAVPLGRMLYFRSALVLGLGLFMGCFLIDSCCALNTALNSRLIGSGVRIGAPSSSGTGG
jgi:hypothetical protein